MDPFPRTTEAIADWLREPTKLQELADLRSWHGDAAMVRALQEVAHLPSERRGAAFFGWIDAMQERREAVGDWPKMAFAEWSTEPVAAPETLALTWQRLGAARLDDDGLLVFPTAPSNSGLFKLTIGESAYVGASEVLARSLQHIRTPGASEQTHLRLRDLATEELRRGGPVEVRVCTRASAGDASLDLDDEEDRALARRAAVAALEHAGVTLLNRR